MKVNFIYFFIFIFQAFEQFYLNNETADVHFLVGDLSVPAHKVVLAAQSDAFKAMFYGELREKDKITIGGEFVTVDAFVKFLKYFYFEDVKLPFDNIHHVLYLGQQYMFEKCVNDCVKAYEEYLNHELVCGILESALFFDITELVQTCNKFISVNTRAIFNSARFLQCTKQILGHILKMNLLSCSEVDVFEACMTWVRAKSKENTVSKEMVEKHLGDLYHDIRFASMTIEELCSLQKKYGAVLDADFISFVDMIATQTPPNQYQKFNMRPRRVVWNANHMEFSFKNGNSRLYQTGRQLTTTFTAHSPIIFGGFKCGMVGTVQARMFKALEADLNVDVQIFEDENNCMQMEAKLDSLVNRFDF